MTTLCFALPAILIISTEHASAQATDFFQPLTAAEYHKIIKQGFATFHFKSDKQLEENFNYQPKNIHDVYDRGFRNLRLRCRPEPYEKPYNSSDFTRFLNKLEEVVDKCIEVGVAPIISWENHQAEAYATEEERELYLLWWKKVAEKLRDKNYHLSFNLFTELGKDKCRNNCSLSLPTNITKYNEWTAAVVGIIRAAGGKNAQRIIILGAPQINSRSLDMIDRSIYENDPYMLVEWHYYAAGPNKRLFRNGRPTERYWSGNGTESQRQVLKNFIELAENFANSGGLLGYFGAWMPRDNLYGQMQQEEVENFARFFVNELKVKNIPWSLNALENYYNTASSEWIIGKQILPPPNRRNRPGVELYMDRVLEVILDAMNN